MKALKENGRKWVRWETAIANDVIGNTKESGGIYIPTNLQNNVLPMCDIDNIDWLEDTPDGKNYIFTDEHFSKKNTRIITDKVKHQKGGNRMVKAKI